MKQVEHFFKNLALDAFMALRPAPAPAGQPAIGLDSTVVFLRLNRIGDALVSTPLLQLIKERFGCRTVVVASSQNYFIFANNPYIDHVIVYRKGSRGIWDARQAAQAFQPTAVIDLHEQLSTTVSLLAGLLRAPYKVAIRKRNAKLFTHTVPDLDPARYHVVERLGHIAAAFGPEADRPALRLTYRVSDEALRKARDFLRPHFPGPHRFVGVNMSAGGEARFWGVENYERLVAALRARGLTPVMMTAPADWERVTRRLDPAQVFCSASFEEFAALISQLVVLFSPDTAAVHVAATYHIPVFGLHVAERPGQLNWYPYGSRYDWIITPNAVADIPFADVWRQFSEFLEGVQLQSVGLSSTKVNGVGAAAMMSLRSK